MMIPIQESLNKYGIKPKGIIVVGAHWVEEHDDFIKCGIERFVYIEPCKEAFMECAKRLNLEDGFLQPNINVCGLTNKDNIYLFQCACGEKESLEPMYVSHQNQGQSNSLLKPNLHLEQHPEVIFDDAEVVKVVLLDSLIRDEDGYDFLYMDVQGAEGLVLKGAIETLKHICIIYTECNRGQTYAGNIEIGEMDIFLNEKGFERVETYWPSPNWTWGDAIFVRKTILNGT